MARVLAKAVLAGSQQNTRSMATSLAQAIEACHAGDPGAITNVLAQARQAAEKETKR